MKGSVGVGVVQEGDLKRKCQGGKDGRQLLTIIYFGNFHVPGVCIRDHLREGYFPLWSGGKTYNI